MTAIEMLKQLKKIETLIKNKRVECLQWRGLAQSVTASVGGERVQSTSNPQKMADAIHRCIELEQETQREIDRLITKKQKVISLIELLPEPEYDVLHKTYVQYMQDKEIAYIRKKSRSWVNTIHDRAIEMLDEILKKEQGYDT